MSDDRPKPQYGEYATPQDQARSIAKSQPPISPLLTPGHGAAAPPPAQVAPAQPPRRRRMWDLVLSIGLLCYGLLNVIAGMFQYSNVAGVINQAYELQGIGEFTSTDLATSVGVAINVVNIGLYLVTLVITVRLLRASKLSFYVPVIGGTLASIVTVVLLLVVVFNDPAFLDYLGSAG